MCSVWGCDETMCYVQNCAETRCYVQDCPVDSVGAVAACVGRRVYLAGGWDGATNNSVHGQMNMLDLNEEPSAWKSLLPMIKQRSFAACAVLGGKETYWMVMLRSESPSDKCANRHTAAANNYRNLSIIVYSHHIFGCYCLRTSRLWWIARSTQRQRSGCNIRNLFSWKFLIPMGKLVWTLTALGVLQFLFCPCRLSIRHWWEEQERRSSGKKCEIRSSIENLVQHQNHAPAKRPACDGLPSR